MINKLANNQAATKNDILRVETSLKKFTTKTELKKTERVLRTEILRVEERLERAEEKLTDKMDGIETKLDKISNQLDGFVG